jgi:hypothetical protein
MKKYFIHNGLEQHGPYSLDELKKKELTAKTMVWYNGMSNWTEVQFIPDLKEFAAVTPPPFEKANPINQPFDKAKKAIDKDYINVIEGRIPNNTGKKVFKYSLIFLAILGLVFIVNIFKPSEEDKERKNPCEFLNLTEAKLEYKGYFGMQPNWRITAKLNNNAHFVTYKDIKYEIEFLTNSQTSLGKIEITDYRVFEPSIQREKGDKFSYIDIELDWQKIPENLNASNTIIKIIDASVYKKENTNN